MTIVPNINLVRNIGFNSDATHTIGSIYSYIRNTPNGNLVFPLKHKKNIFENNSADTLVSLKVFGNKNDGKISKNIFKLYFIIDRIISKIKVKTFVKNLFTSEYANQNH
jgi:hypothetical protein